MFEKQGSVLGALDALMDKKAEELDVHYVTTPQVITSSRQARAMHRQVKQITKEMGEHECSISEY